MPDENIRSRAWLDEINYNKSNNSRYLVSTSLIVFFTFSLKQKNEIEISEGIPKQDKNKQPLS